MVKGGGFCYTCNQLETRRDSGQIPGPRSSVLWEMLREGIEDAEKIWWLRAEGASCGKLDEVLRGFDYKQACAMDDAALRALVDHARAALEDAARTRFARH